MLLPIGGVAAAESICGNHCTSLTGVTATVVSVGVQVPLRPEGRRPVQMMDIGAANTPSVPVCIAAIGAIDTVGALVAIAVRSQISDLD
jgi:hypothetical protein